ncbi:MAG: N-acetylmuramoyl-L-alanine amidase [Steroidobacteraceae bacterium]
MYRRLAIVVALLLGVAFQAQAVEVRDVRLSTEASTQRVVVDLSGRTAHRFSTLANPDRLVLDLQGARAQRKMVSSLAASGAVKAIRMAPRGSHDLRVVVDLAHRVRARSFSSTEPRGNGYRLVIEWREPTLANARAETSAATMSSAASISPATSPSPAASMSSVASGSAVAAAPAERSEASTAAAPMTLVPASASRELPVKVEHAPAASRDLLIAIDAGHGGEDPGATGKGGTHEKDVVLAIARELALQLGSEPGMRAILIRDGDYFIPLRDRMQRARRQQADLFVSVHADSIRNRAVAGSSVYILSQRGATDEAARWLAERENAADLVGGVTLDNKDDVLASVLLDLSQTAALNASQAAASSVLKRLDRVGEVRKRQVQQARFVVLKSPDIPSMLVETAYISNPGEEHRLRSREFRGRIAAAIRQGLRDYFYTNPPAGTRIAQLAAQKSASPSVALVSRLDRSGT